MPTEPAASPAPPSTKADRALLWEPGTAERENARVTAYMDWLARDRGLLLGSYGELWRWSVTEVDAFWESVWAYFGVAGERGAGPVRDAAASGARWFPGATLNYARNALRHARTNPGAPAVIARSASGGRTAITWAELAAETARVAAGLRDLGVEQGDHVAGRLPNAPEALIAFLAAAAIGAVWSVRPPGPGTGAAAPARIGPKVLFTSDPAAAEELRSAPTGPPTVVGDLPGAVAWADLGAGGAAREPAYTAVGFDHPLWVLDAADATGAPRPVAHGHGGIVLEHLKTLVLHRDIGRGDVLLLQADTGSTTWNHLVGGLLAGATVLLYDSGDAGPEPGRLWRIADEEGADHLGLDARHLDACARAGAGADGLALERLRGIGSWGPTPSPETSAWVYRDVKRDVLLGPAWACAELCAELAGPSPLLPARAGVIAARCLGARVELRDGGPIITRPMPSMPVDPAGPGGGEDPARAGAWPLGDRVTVLGDGGCVLR
ncbi:acetoacetyl-CoA synthetase [Spinactinospora alkalitolerans]|uniref:Acetoacetyl-CoA synthetase n=1 Tax=Spinactinospora alkalitolerans TaxID=687207 RepID=A0A852U0J6_9ACTN|nr:AMP-binding protein [Spinactinospora alkalitolerans]NYE49621.1 acetoacetyl-CoA synthetase [Spinactinospora alkalitolerans]